MNPENLYDNINRQVAHTKSEIERLSDEFLRSNREKLQREISNYEALQEIAENTRVLKSLFQVIHENKGKQDEIIDLLTEIISINKASSKKEAESRYRKIMDKISNFTGDVDTINKLQVFLVTTWRHAAPIFDKLKDGL